MARRIAVVDGNGELILTEVEADNEEELRTRLKETPELLPVDEFGLSGPVLIVGRETSVASGSVDLVAVTPTGDVLIIEMKTGPRNSDFRRALTQATDYGAELWTMTREVFETTVATRYFSGEHCSPRFHGLTLSEAAALAWPDLSDEDREAFDGNLASVLATGNFHFVVVAQRFAPSMITTAKYLNEIGSGRAFFILVELVRFDGDRLSAFEARTILTSYERLSTTPAALTHETNFWNHVAGSKYGEMLVRLFDTATGLRFLTHWGTKGASLRLPTAYKPQPISIAWIFPPGVDGWLGLQDVTMGYHLEQTAQAEEVMPALARFLDSVSKLPTAVPVTKKSLVGCTLHPDHFVESIDAVVDAMAVLVEDVNGLS
jgi:hypothetical protein